MKSTPGGPRPPRRGPPRLRSTITLPGMSPRHLAALLPLVGLLGCDLEHSEQRGFCASASSDPGLCASRPDWCIPDGGAACVERVAGADCSDCRPAAEADGAACVAAPGVAADWPSRARYVKDGAVTPIEEYDWQHLDRAKVEPLVGRRPSEAEVEALSDHDRRMLCGRGAGGDWNGLLPARLDWRPEEGRAACVYDEAFCTTMCTVHTTRFQCIPKNLCNGVICL